MSHLGTFSSFSDSALTASVSCIIPATATYATLMVGMRGSDSGATTLSSAVLGAQAFTLNNTILREFTTFQAVEAGYILAADMPIGTLTATATRGTATAGMTISVSFFDDAAQQVPTIGLAGNNGGGDPFDTSITMPTAGIIVDGISTASTGFVFTTNQTGQTQESTNDASSLRSYSSVRTVGSGSQTMGWDTSGTTNRITHVLLGIEAGVAGDSVSPPDPLTDGATTQAYSPTGFASGAINSVTLDGVAVPAFTQTTFDNFDIPTIASDAGTLGSKLGTVTFEASNGTETANDTTVNEPQANYAGITMVTVDTVTPEYLYDLMQDVGLTLATNDQFNYPNADGSTIANDGGWNFLTLPKTFQYYESGSGKWYELTMSTSGALGPVLTLPTGTATGQTTASGTVTTDTGDGTLYYLFSENSSELAATIKAANSQAISATGLQNVTYTGLTAGTTYYPHYIQTDAALDDSNVSTGSSFVTDAIVAPVLASTKALSGIIDQSFSKTLTIQGGDPATSWLITGGADQAEYSLSNAGVLTRDVPNPTEESEVITVTATNAGGTSNTQTVTITYTASSIPPTKFRRFPWQSWNPL